jgi:hypothetical protein
MKHSILQMNMAYKICLFLGISLSLVGIVFYIQHYHGGFMALNLGALFSITAIVIALREISKSTNLTFNQKVNWFIFFFLAGQITGIVYLFKREGINKHLAI